jgi:aminoglycoside phosphotransferase family enzyme/predicted kinase
MTSATADDSRDQESIFAFLTDPVTHPQAKRIDTHAASVFLEGSRALKIKRAVRLPFLDYSTLEQRKTACDEEIRINRQFAPQIYRRVVPITRNDDGSLSIDGSGAPVEYAVEMTRFDERQTIDHLAEAGPLDPGLVEAIADAIAASHAAAPRVPAEHWIESIPHFIADSIAAFRAAACFPADDIDELAKASQLAFFHLHGLLEQRRRQGYVRRCHGDLHLGNIVVIEQRPVLFDAIEFDEKVASIDVLYDLAFPLMDLLRYGRQAEANGLLNRYLSITSDENLGALAAFPLLLSIRAAIRAHVLLARLGRSNAEKAPIVEMARAYFELARALIHPPEPMLIAVGGLSGTGKSALARRLAPFIGPQPGAVVVRSDVLRKQLFEVGETERLPADAYLPEVSERIYDALGQDAAHIVSQGHSVVADAVFAREAERAAIEDAARRLGIRFVGLFLVADLQTRQNRVLRRGPDASDATAEVAGLQEKYNIGTLDWTSINACGSLDTTLEQCRTRIADFQATH